MLVARNYQPTNLVRVLPMPGRNLSRAAEALKTSASATALQGRKPTFPRPYAFTGDFEQCCNAIRNEAGHNEIHPESRDPLYLLACHMEWEQRGDASAAWEIISAARSSHEDTRAHARSLLERTQQVKIHVTEKQPAKRRYRRKNSTMETRMRTPYGLELIESCMSCTASRDNFFCRFSQPVLRAMDAVSHHTIMPGGAVLFVEGQTPRGLFILCSGKVNLSTASKDGKVLILKQAEPGEALGLSAAISGTKYEMTAETAMPCQLNYVGRQDFMKLMQQESEIGMHVAQWLSREFQNAYRDIHDLVLARSSSGKLARLLLSCARPSLPPSEELHLRSAMTHEEMAQRIGSSRETVTRALSDLKKKRLIRLEGARLIIRNRTGLEAVAM